MFIHDALAGVVRELVPRASLDEWIDEEVLGFARVDDEALFFFGCILDAANFVNRPLRLGEEGIGDVQVAAHTGLGDGGGHFRESIRCFGNLPEQKL